MNNTNIVGAYSSKNYYKDETFPVIESVNFKIYNYKGYVVSAISNKMSAFQYEAIKVLPDTMSHSDYVGVIGIINSNNNEWSKKIQIEAMFVKSIGFTNITS